MIGDMANARTIAGSSNVISTVCTVFFITIKGFRWEQSVRRLLYTTHPLCWPLCKRIVVEWQWKIRSNSPWQPQSSLHMVCKWGINSFSLLNLSVMPHSPLPNCTQSLPPRVIRPLETPMTAGEARHFVSQTLDKIIDVKVGYFSFFWHFFKLMI